jgi:hypothetical protein
VTLKVSPFTISVWHQGEEICTHTKALRKGDHQYLPEHYLELLTRKPRAVMNAAPLKKGVMPQEMKDFFSQCRDKDKEQQLLQILLLGRSVEPDQLLWAVRQANQSGSPTYQLVSFYLNIGNPIVQAEPQPCITVEHTNLAEYDRLMGGEPQHD